VRLSFSYSTIISVSVVRNVLTALSITIFIFLFVKSELYFRNHVKVNNQNSDFDKNLDLFKVEAIHNGNIVKNWFLMLEERYQLLRNTNPEYLNETLDDDDDLVRIKLYLGIKKSPKKEQYQKLKIDDLNFLSGRDYKMAD
jgi:hypothetical protein